MNRVVSVVADLSAFYWVLTVLGAALGSLDVWSAFAGFIILILLKLANGFKVPIMTVAVNNARGFFTDFIEWNGGAALIRVNMRGEGGIKIFLSMSTLAFALTLVVSLAGSSLHGLDWGKIVFMVIVFALSAVFYRNNSVYIRAVGIAVSVLTAVAYATLVSLAVGLVMGGDSPLTLSVLINFTAVIVGCDILTIKWAILNNTRTLIIGGLGLHDAVILIPTASYLVSSLAASVLL